MFNSSNKKPDAYFMLGRSYEQVGNLVEACWVYEEPSLRYPNYERIKLMKSNLNALKQELPSPFSGIPKKTTPQLL